VGKFRPVDCGFELNLFDIDFLPGRPAAGQTSLRIAGRPYTTIETNLVKRLVEVVMADADKAFLPLSHRDVHHRPAGNNPRFAGSPARQCRHPGAVAHRHGGSRRQCYLLLALAPANRIRNVRCRC